MKKYNEALSNITLRHLCIKNDWFTAGTNEQYARLFEMNDNGASVKDLAMAIWFCSSDVAYTDIVEALEEATAWPIYVDYIIEKLERLEFGETELEIIREALTTHQDAGKAYRVVRDSE